MSTLNMLLTFGIPLLVGWTLLRRRFSSFRLIGDQAGQWVGRFWSSKPEPVPLVPAPEDIVDVSVSFDAITEVLGVPAELIAPEPEPEADDRPGYDDEDEDDYEEEEEEEDELDDDEVAGYRDEGDEEAPTPVLVPRVLPPAPAPKIEIQLLHWIDDLLERAIHLLVVGGTGGGKTVFLHHLASLLWAQGHSILVLDPDAAPGDWPEGVAVLGAGDDFDAIGKGLAWVAERMKERREARAQGQRTFDRIDVIIDEYADVTSQVPVASPIVESVLRRARKLNIHLFLGVQDSQTGTMGFDRKSKLLENLMRVSIYLANGRRWCKMPDGSVHRVPQFDIPEHSEVQVLTDRPTLPTVRTPQVSDLDDDDEDEDGPPDLLMSELSSKDRAILQILQARPDASANSIYTVLGGDRQRLFARVKELRQMVGQ